MSITRDNGETTSGPTECTNLSSENELQSDKLAAVLESDHADGGLSFFKGDCRIRVANCFELRDRAYRFIYEIYQGLGYAGSNSNRRWLTVYDALPDTTTLIAENKKGDLAGALTLVFDSAMGLPGDSMFKMQLDSLRNDGARLCESMSFATAENTRGSIKTIGGLFYCGYLLASRAKKATHWTTNVIEKHERFYCRNLLFERVGPVNNCSRAQGLPVVLLVLPFELPNTQRKVRRIFPLSMLNYSDTEEAAISSRVNELVTPMTEDEFCMFFSENSEVYSSASGEQKQILKKLYTL
jgi:hypothetical protein